LVRPSFADASPASASAIARAPSSFAASTRFFASFSAAAEALAPGVTAGLILKMRKAAKTTAEIIRGICQLSTCVPVESDDERRTPAAAAAL